MAHLDLAEGAGGPRPPFGFGSAYLNIQQSPWSVERGAWTVLTTDNVSRAPFQPKNRQVRLVYKCWKFAGKVSFSLTFGDPRRALQAAMLTRHVVAAEGDRA
jgi:hypothetical protein